MTPWRGLQNARAPLPEAWRKFFPLLRKGREILREDVAVFVEREIPPRRMCHIFAAFFAPFRLLRGEGRASR